MLLLPVVFFWIILSHTSFRSDDGCPGIGRVFLFHHGRLNCVDIRAVRRRDAPCGRLHRHAVGRPPSGEYRAPALRGASPQQNSLRNGLRLTLRCRAACKLPSGFGPRKLGDVTSGRGRGPRRRSCVSPRQCTRMMWRGVCQVSRSCCAPARVFLLI